jgi:hypothetical protein
VIATLLIVTVFSAGGPHWARPGAFPGVTVIATCPSGRTVTLTTDRNGRSYLRGAPGTYLLQPRLRPPSSSPTPRLGNDRSVTVRGRVARVRLFIPIR